MNQTESLSKNRRIAETGIFLALFLGLAYAFCYIPNVEFITAVAFMAGLFLGLKRGLFVAVMGETIFSIANPLGSGLAYPAILFAQIIAFACFAATGALYRHFIPGLSENKPVLSTLILAATGSLFSLLLNFLTTLAFSLISGFDATQIAGSFIAGLPFYSIHMVSNTIIFALLLKVILSYVMKYYSHYFEVL